MHDPEVLIMDEPTDGLDPNQKYEARNLIKRMGENKAIIFSTHILEEVEAVCSRVIIIDRGRIVANGTPQELKARSPEGRLDDVFRSDHAARHGEGRLSHHERLEQHQSDHEARAGELFLLAHRLRLPGHLPAARRLLHVHDRQLLRARRGLARVVLHLASVAVPVPGPGGRHAPVVGGAPPGHDGAAAHHADHDLAGDSGQVSRLVALPRAGARADVSGRGDGQLHGRARTTASSSRDTSGASCCRAPTSR